MSLQWLKSSAITGRRLRHVFMVAFMSCSELLRPCCSAWWICAASCSSIICNVTHESNFTVLSNKWILRYVIEDEKNAAKEEVNKSELVASEEEDTGGEKKAGKVRRGRRHKRGGMEGVKWQGGNYHINPNLPQNDIYKWNYNAVHILCSKIS